MPGRMGVSGMRQDRFGMGSGAVFAMLAAAAVAYLLITALGVGSSALQPVSVLTSIALTDDDNGSALFPATALAPDRPVSRCIRIHYSGSAPAGRSVRLAARDLRGDLVSQLTVRVEVGSGGGFAGCDGFRGQTAYAGRLDGLGVEAGIGTGWTPSPGEARTYRLTVTLSPRAKAGAGRAAATLEWLATGSTSPEPAAPATAVPAPVTSPSRRPAPQPAASRRESPVVAPNLGAVAPGRTPPPAGTPTVDPSTAAERPRLVPMPSGWRSMLSPKVKRALRAVLAVADRSRRDGRYPLGVLVLLLLFLLVQRRIDRSDPKLALAPVRAVRHVDLPNPGETIFVRPGHPSVTPVRRAFPHREAGVPPVQ
jgi:hypothetical protein